ncbi:N-alpha-acetyltransferase 40-like isoform X1 [Chenopodium quinoa]|uniref:N-alpha-acetyltransferase 40-like isoform X1 n=2 Tax=Chenopodium quinoa TaxID=63459 RepID=UPI000B76CC3D|nr:N-alpha-acetyltransferase 40-like isoform X1 [Chenopodium quinoa]
MEYKCRKNVDIYRNNERTTKRKEILEKKRIVNGLIKAASSLKDPLASFPEFLHYNQQGLCLCLEGGRGTKLSRSLKQYAQKLVKQNMEQYYGTEWAKEEKVKCREMVAPEARYIFVYEVPTVLSNTKKRLMPTNEHKGDVVGFVHYRFIMEEELPVLYVYELQLEQRIQGKGLGKLLMQLLELIAHKNCMATLMLTVQKANLSAMFFYTSKLGYCISRISPSRVDPVVGLGKSYEILCKAFDQEAKNKLEQERRQ